MLGAFGVRGWVKIKPLGQNADALLQQATWGLNARGNVRDVDVEEVKEHGSSVLAKLAGIDDREQAESLRGADVTVQRRALPDAGPGEYYWTDLIGLVVRNEQGVVLGTVSGLIDAPAHDVLRVASESHDGKTAREQLIPFVEPIIRAVDVAGGSITVDWQNDY